MWILFAFGSAVFARLTAILSKIGIKNTDSNVATALRTVIVLLFSWLMVLIVGSQRTISEVSGRTLLFLLLSGFATGGSWLCYYRALQSGPASVVVPIDKLSILFTIAFSYFFLKEKLSGKAMVGIVLIVVGTMSLLF